ncbi:hypothetical protein GAU_2818 [Gemmatimonas aurantiaca T-27]|uniref:Uncharacterized protein n=1 Tax=Gemmatimonas aurantiaca (strain DSM 14586 / JCM 11422 / NBRC 100505 / T-27) TaxID=379066 RepID=C1ABI3_GEMAT|nr:hypothetical protein [Gemmatimonas aurantiaca]BAH39860.1 hypothetical protein GAU_2818 [Gemmatimonas aurantiaca T-27]
MISDTPLDPWMLDLARRAVDELDADVVVPREMMWARIAKARQAGEESTTPVAASFASVAAATTASVSPIRRPSRWTRWTAQVAAVAAVLVAGVAIGRYAVPASNVGASTGTDSVAAAPSLGPEALAAMPRSNDPSFVAMQEHLATTVSLLTVVRDDDAPATADADHTQRARDLLITTRLLLDQPQLRDERTRRLLQDLELVLLQVIQARGSAPETQLAPKETMRETNLLTRVRALVAASAQAGDVVYGGD